MELAEMYAGCVAGAIRKGEYMLIAEKAGFTNLTIRKEKNITLPDDILNTYLSAEEIEEFRQGGAGSSPSRSTGKKRLPAVSRDAVTRPQETMEYSLARRAVSQCVVRHFF